ncbi:MAG: DNA topoisomerase IV subunit A [Planctomycetota bacterium]|nr:DNA topoisomerase IV subunit A [Planctomycetota bacterium]
MAKKDQTGAGDDHIEYVSIDQETRRRYLNYALSVISSRALPDVRDGLKPVQRRILYVMHQELGLMFNSKTRKCAKITGDTTGNYHPHGQVAVYEALVRMAQDFTLRYPVVYGQGNFGSVMGLPQAAERYTEAKLTAIAEQLMEELRYQTVDMRPNYDATREEPVVLPARYPNLLVNGSQGIAVGMATSIPPHNLTEVIKACVHLIASPDSTVAQVMKYVKGPDFPLGGRIVSDRKSLRKSYEEGKGSIKLRGEWKFDRDRRGEINNRVIIFSVPYGVETGPLLSTIGEIVVSRKLPQLLDVADETDEKNGLRIVLEIKPGADPEAVMAYLYKHTPLEQNIPMNLTSLITGEHGEIVPARLSLVEMLQHFLKFRFETVRRRFEYQLKILLKRIHILEGFAIVFEGLDKALRIIRASDGRRDAAEKLMKVFPLDEEQTFAILDMALYKISQLEIDNIIEELEEKRAEAKKIQTILASDKKLWSVVKSELEEIAEKFGDKRRTSVGSSDEIAEYDPEAYIVRENTNVVITTDGWIKRVGRLQNVETTRVREGDKVLEVVPGSTLDHVVFFSSDGIAYTLRMDQVPPSSGYGEPLSKHFRLGDGASIVAAISTDPRFTPEDKTKKSLPVPLPFLLVATARGQAMRISFSPFRVASTKAGRKFCRLSTGDKVVGVEMISDATSIFLASHHARILHCSLDDIPILSGVGKGLRGIKLATDDELLGFSLMSRPSDCLRVRTSGDKTLTFGQLKYGMTSRGGKGVKTSHRSTFEELIRPEIQLVDWTAIEEGT